MIKIAMLSTGEEVLYGDIVDTNAAWLSRLFYQTGFPLSKRSTVGDQKKALANELVSLSLNFDVVIVNGGLGPTSDDLTAEAASVASDQDLTLFDDWVTVMQNMFSQSGRKMPVSNMKQAMLPEKAIIVDNPVGTACGFAMTINDALFYFTPGVPREFKIMVEQQILPQLKEKYPQNIGGDVSRLYTFGLTESGISDMLDNLVLPQGFELGYRSYLPFIEVKLFGPREELDTRIKLLQIIYSHLGDNVVSVDEEMLNNIGALLTESNLRISVAEIATGGFLSSQLQDNDLSESMLLQGWVLNNVGKVELEDSDPLAAALALAGSIREKTNSDIGLSIGKMVDNQIAISLSTHSGEWGQLVELRRKYDRKDQKKVLTVIALDMLRRHQENKSVFGNYSSVKRVRELFVPASML